MLRYWLRQVRIAWGILPSHVRIAVVLAAGTLLAALAMAAWATPASPGALTTLGEVDIPRVCADGCILLSRAQVEALGVILARCGVM